MADTVRLTVVVSGRVQGVGFRDWARRRAGTLGLSGSAVNLPDGRVEIRAEGTPKACDALLDALYSRQGPGRVHGIDVSWSEAVGDSDGFRIG
jgi:acylphosphatase